MLPRDERVPPGGLGAAVEVEGDQSPAARGAGRIRGEGGQNLEDPEVRDGRDGAVCVAQARILSIVLDR